MFDISSIEVVDTFDVEILHPRTQEPMVEDGKTLSITIHGPGTAPFKAAQAAASAKALARLKAKGKVEPTAEEDAANTAAFLASVTVSLNGFSYNGQHDGREAFRALYADPKMGWVTEQVNRAAGDWANFTKASPGN